MVKFCQKGLVCAALKIDQHDFSIKFNQQQVWTASWKGSGDRESAKLQNSVTDYHVSSQIRLVYEKELPAWIDNGWLIPYPHEKLWPPKGLIPLMAIVLENKGKIRSVMDYQELNQCVDAFTTNADVCARKLWEWHQHGSNVSLLDLKRTSLQVWVSETLWPFQTVMFVGRRYCFTILGIGLNIALQIIKTIIGVVLSQEEKVKRGRLHISMTFIWIKILCHHYMLE